MKTTMKTIIGTTPNGREFKLNTKWEDNKVVCQSVEYLKSSNRGAIIVPIRQSVTTAQAWHYLRTGDDSGKKIFAT